MDKKITRSNNKAFFKKSIIAAACLAVAAAAYGFTQTEQTGRSQQVTATSLTISTVQQGEFVDGVFVPGQEVGAGDEAADKAGDGEANVEGEQEQGDEDKAEIFVPAADVVHPSAVMIPLCARKLDCNCNFSSVQVKVPTSSRAEFDEPGLPAEEISHGPPQPLSQLQGRWRDGGRCIAPRARGGGEERRAPERK